MMLEALSPGLLKIESLRFAAPGEASDTGDAYLCIAAVMGREADAFEAVKLLVQTELPNAGLQVLGPF